MRVNRYNERNFLANLREKLPGRGAILGQLWRYCITGGLAFVVDFGIFAVLLYAADVHYLVANLFGLVGGLVLNYLISVGWVFTECRRNFEREKRLEFFLFSLIGILGVALNQFLMWLCVGCLEWNPAVSKILAAGIVLMWNFGARKGILFRGKKEVV